MTEVNPLLTRGGPDGDLVPYLQPGELLVLKRKGIQLDIQDPEYGRLSLTGFLLMTSQRLVMVSKNCNSGNTTFSSFGVSLSSAVAIEFIQPILGSNYLDGRSTGDTGVTQWYVYMKEGGCGTLIPLLERFWIAARRRSEGRSTNEEVDTNMDAYRDPTDPSVVYIQSQAQPLDPME